MRYRERITTMLAAMLVALLATAPGARGETGQAQPSFGSGNHPVAVAGISSKVWRERYSAQAAAGSTHGSVAASGKASSAAFARRSARPARPIGPEITVIAAPTFTSGALAGGCGARRAERPRPWCEAKAGN